MEQRDETECNCTISMFLGAVMLETISMVEKPVAWIEARIRTAVLLGIMLPLEASILLAALPISFLKTLVVVTFLGGKKAK